MFGAKAPPGRHCNEQVGARGNLTNIFRLRDLDIAGTGPVPRSDLDPGFCVRERWLSFFVLLHASTIALRQSSRKNPAEKRLGCK